MNKLNKTLITTIGFIIAIIIPSITLIIFRNMGRIGFGTIMFFILLIIMFTIYKITILDRWWSEDED